jgi:hypothetical protein
MRTERQRATPKTGYVRIVDRPIDSIRPSPENDQLYRPVDPEDHEFLALVESVREHGVKEALTITLDRWIISGHRRYAAARAAGLATVPCRVEPIRKDADHDRFIQLLRECNRQRVKTRAELLREEIVSADPDEAYASLIAYREAASAVAADNEVVIRGEKRRAGISNAKMPFLAAANAVIAERRDFWPLSVRSIHYGLLNDPPLIHASKPGSRYTNTLACYKSLSDLLTRARMAGLIAMDVIDDETRPVTVWNVHASVQTFLQAELDGMFKGYWRDLLQSQPNHVEIVAEKLTVNPIIRPIAGKYCLPLTISRGFSSLPPRQQIAKRYRKSGKERLILIAVSDFDPDGEEIAHSIARSLRDDFGIAKIDAIKAALTADQVDQFKLPPKIRAKATSTNYHRFKAKHGDDVFELEALEPTVLQCVLTAAIDQVIDVRAFNAELDAERQDAAFLAAVRNQVRSALSRVDGVGGL